MDAYRLLTGSTASLGWGRASGVGSPPSGWARRATGSAGTRLGNGPAGGRYGRRRHAIRHRARQAVDRRYFFGRSIRTMSEFWRERSNTRYFPSGVMSNVIQVAAIAEVGELTDLVRGEIDQPEVLGFDARQVDQARTAAQETVGSAHADPHLRHFHRGAVGSHATERVPASGPGERAGIDNQVTVRRPDRIAASPRRAARARRRPPGS